jgi:hypothetical protein
MQISKMSSGLQLLSDICNLHNELEKIQTYIDYEEVEFDEDEPVYSYFFTLSTRTEDIVLEDENEVLSYLWQKTSTDMEGYIHFQYEPKNAPDGSKCSLVFRHMDQILSYLYRTGVLVKKLCE